MRHLLNHCASSESYIYAYIDPDGEILYVGRTTNPRTRDRAHRRSSPWCSPGTAFALVDVADGWDAGRAAEAKAINMLRPRHNVHHNVRAAS